MAITARDRPETPLSASGRRPYTSLSLNRSRLLPGLLAGIAVLAAIVRLGGLAVVSLQGDEYNTITDIAHLGRNPSSLLYDTILRAFTTFGWGVEVLRLPSVIFGVLAVVAIYFLASLLVDRSTGIVASLLLCTSAYAVNYSQEVRFYSLYLCAGILALQSFALVARRGPTTGRITWLIGANLLCVASDSLGGLVLLGEVISYVILTSEPGRMVRRLAVVGVVVVGCISLLAIPAVVRAYTDALDRLTAAQVAAGTPHGLHITSFVKIAWTAFVFTFGERVYPLWLWFTLPGTVIVGALLLRGLWKERQNRLVLGILVPQFVLGPVVLYLILDAVTTSQYTAISPRYLIPLLGPFVVLLATGITSWRRPNMLLALLLGLLVNAGSLYAYWQNDWTYNGYTADWPGLATLVQHTDTS